MENQKDLSGNKFNNFVGFIPKPLKLEDKPELAVFPFNVVIGRYTVRNEKCVLGSAIYEPDLSSLFIEKTNNLVLNYYNRFDRRYHLKMIIENGGKTRICEKYRENEKIGSAYTVIDWKKQEESWKKFFMKVALLGLDNGERCHFS